MNTCVCCGKPCKDEEHVCRECWEAERNDIIINDSKCGIGMALVLNLIVLIVLGVLTYGFYALISLFIR